MNMAGNTMESRNKQTSDTHLKSALSTVSCFITMDPSKVSLSTGLTTTKIHDVQRANYRVFRLLDNKGKVRKNTEYEMLS